LTQAADVVRSYLDALVAHDWDALAATLAPDVVRVGPFLDEYRGRNEYVTFLRDLMPTLPEYEMRVDRIVGTESVAIAQLRETVAVGGQPVETPEAIVFDVANDVITRVGVYIQRG